jgi:class 3 adenylate cyclase
MDNDRIEKLLEERQTDEVQEKAQLAALEKTRTEVTILFSDIQGSTSYFERKGDAEGLAMVERHNKLLFPAIEGAGGRVVKTIGDAIMACFKDPVKAISAAIRMQQVLEADRAKKKRADDYHIHIRVALHKGLGLEKDNDVFGDVVNATAKVQQQAQPDQILITDALLEAAKQGNTQCAKLGRAQIKGKDEAIDIYAVAWSPAASEQLVEEVQKQFEAKLKDLRRQKEQIEEELETSREQWRSERRRLTKEIEELEAEGERGKEVAGHRVSDELQAQTKFYLDEAVRAKQQMEQELISAQARWEIERGRLRTQIDSLQGAALEAIEQTNNPARLALAVREQVDSRLKDAKFDWQLQWESERRQLNAEVERLKKAGNIDDKRDAARRALLQKLGKLPAGTIKTAEDWEKEFDAAKGKWDGEREQASLKIQQLERQIQHSKDSIRQEVFQELRSQYEPKLEAYEHERKRLKDDLESVNLLLADERQRLTSRIEYLERLVPDAQEAVRTQVTAELRAEFDAKVEEINRLRTRNERRAHDATEEAEIALRKASKEIARLQDELREAREVAFRAQRGTRPSPASSHS